MKSADKQSFVLYTDWAIQLEKLSMEQRGVLFSNIFNHAKNITLLEMDDKTDMLFSIIQAQLERDLQKWNATRKKRAEAGARGAEITNSKRQNAANADFAEQEAANAAVIVNDSVTEYENETERMNNACFVKLSNSNSNFMQLYEEMYLSTFGKPHPVITAEQCQRCASVLLSYEVEGMKPNEQEHLIRYYFENVTQCDHNINHFCADGGNIITNCAHNVIF